jgi:hypothetical protein
VCTLRDVCRRDSGESYTCARPTGQRGLRTPAFGADTVTGREEPVRHVVRGPFGFLGPRPARPAVNIHSFFLASSTSAAVCSLQAARHPVWMVTALRATRR